MKTVWEGHVSGEYQVWTFFWAIHSALVSTMAGQSYLGCHPRLQWKWIPEGSKRKGRQRLPTPPGSAMIVGRVKKDTKRSKIGLRTFGSSKTSLGWALGLAWSFRWPCRHLASKGATGRCLKPLGWCFYRKARRKHQERPGTLEQLGDGHMKFYLPDWGLLRNDELTL